jgi:hypothetical protein
MKFLESLLKLERTSSLINLVSVFTAIPLIRVLSMLIPFLKISIKNGF